MSRRQIRVLVLSLTLAFTFSTLPAIAATRDRDGAAARDLPVIEQVLKRLQKFVLRSFSDGLTLPKP